MNPKFFTITALTTLSALSFSPMARAAIVPNGTSVANFSVDRTQQISPIELSDEQLETMADKAVKPSSISLQPCI